MGENKEQFSVTLDKEVFDKIEQNRGFIARSTYINKILRENLL